MKEGIRESWARRRLIRYLVQADVKKTGADTLLGNVWWVFDPLLQMMVYVILVTVIFARSQPDYPLFVFSAVLPWKWFTASVNDAISSVVSQERLIKQLQFPKIVLPLASTFAAVVHFLFGLIPLTGLLVLFYGDRLSPYVVLVLPIAGVQLVFSMAVALVLGALNVFVRDVGNISRHVLRLWFYLSPGLYAMSQPREELDRPRRSSLDEAPEAQPVRDPVRVVPGRHLRHGRRRALSARLGAAGRPADGIGRPCHPRGRLLRLEPQFAKIL